MRWKGLLPITIAALLAAASPAAATTFDVTTNVDRDDGVCPALPTSPPCTLRAALVAAHENGIVDPDVINVPAGDYLLTAGELDFGTTNQLVTLRGAGADTTTIRSSGTDRVIEVGGESEVALERLTVSGGAVGGDSRGGNLYVWSGALALDHVRVTGGNASGGGGGIAADNSTLAIRQSLIDGNEASGGGGGILSFSNSNLELVDSTVTGNSAIFGAGGIGVQSTDDPQAFTHLTRVTLAGNSATQDTGGGLVLPNGASPAQIAGSILAANTGVSGPSNCAGVAPTDGGGNLESGFDCGFTGASSRQTPSTGLATTLTNAGGTLPVLEIAPDSPARELAGACMGSDQRDVVRPQGALCDAGAFEYLEPVAPPPPPPNPTPTPAPPPVVPTPTPTPAPVFQKTVVVGELSGTILVRKPGSSKYEAIDASEGIPLGSTIDARKGVVVLTSVPKAGGTPEVAKFFDGVFKVSQTGGITTVTLSEPLAPCGKGARASAKKPKTRKLWGEGKGKFRTRGQYSAATIRGTKWLVEDGCRYTKTRVTQGTVAVRDEVKDKTIVLRKGKSYTARPRR